MLKYSQTMWGMLRGNNLYIDCDMDLGIIHGSVGEKCFQNFNGHLKFTHIEQNINNWAFKNAKYIPNEIIVKKRDGFTTTYAMGYGAFINTNVEKIDLSDSAITVLNSVEGDPASNYSNDPAYVYRWADAQPFYDAKHLKIIHLPKNMTTIPSYGLAHLPSLTTVTLPEKLTTIKSYAFYKDGNLESISIPNTVQLIETYAFAYCRNLKTLNLDSPLLTIIPSQMCFYCWNLETVTLPPKVIQINTQAFSYCCSLKRIVLPNTVTQLSPLAFESCATLESVTFEDSTIGTLTRLGYQCFAWCDALKEVPDMSNLLGGVNDDYIFSPFFACKSLTLMILLNKPTNTSESTYYSYFYMGSAAKLLVPEGYAYTYQLNLSGANWELRNFLDFIQSIPDRTGDTATKFKLGADYRNTRVTTGTSYGSATAYASVYTQYKNYYVKEIDGILESSTTQEDETWVLVSDYVSAKNCTLS